MSTQRNEWLIVDGERRWIACSPGLPWDHPGVRELTANEAANDDICQWVSTNLTRGYIGTWEIRDSRLFVIGIEGRWRLVDEKPIWASWFSGNIRVSLGPVLDTRMGFDSVYERELWMLVLEGIVMERFTVDNRGKV